MKFCEGEKIRQPDFGKREGGRREKLKIEREGNEIF